MSKCREAYESFCEQFEIDQSMQNWCRWQAAWNAATQNAVEIAAAKVPQLETLVAQQAAVIEQMREALKVITRRANCLDVLEIARTANEALALSIQCNQDALHEALAKECERLAKTHGVGVMKWLCEEAAAHRARKENSHE